MDILSGFLSDVLKEVVCGAVNQLQYSFCFNSFVKELEKEKENLIETKISVEDRVIHAQRQTLKTAEVIHKWLENANTNSEFVNRLLRETNAKKSCFFGYFPNWIWRYRLGKKLAIKKGDLQKIIQEGRQYIQLQRTASIPSNTFDILTEKSINFDSRKSAFDQLVKALKDDGVAMIGLYGMGGCGKTTLAMEVKKIAEAEHLFHKVVFVPVSSTVEVPRIQEKIASSLQYPFPENQEMERAQRLCMRLTQEKILMILDDVWEKLDFGRIGIPSSEYHKGCKILITTRLKEVCISMDCQKNIYLPFLTDEESWTLFQNKALISKDTPENINHLAISISKECKGLPVAIVAVASSLKGKEEVIWRAALNKLKSSKQINIGKGLRDPYKCLKLSYDNLDDEEAKSLFLLCSAFPEDYEISVECLIRCAIGLGVAGEVGTYEEARTEMTAVKMNLVSSCLMMEAGVERVKMHDLVRDVAHWIAKNENKMIKCEVEKGVSLEEGSIRYLWCVKFPDGMDCSNLEFLTIQTKLEVSDGIFERMGKLRVLIITNKNNYRLQLSTTSFKSLTNLRCLVLQYWELSDISFLRDMKKLQSLSFHGCSLPSFLDLQTDVAVTTLTNLKLLEFISCDIESNIFEEIKRIPFLEELYICKDYPKDRKEESVKFSNSFSVPQKLQRYGIILEYNFYNYCRMREFFSYERTLGINYFDISNEVIKGLAKKAKELFVGNIKGGAKNMMPDIFEIEEGMNELKELGIGDSEEIECLVDTSNHLSKMGNIFSNLRYMEIFKMNHLKTLWHGCLPANGSFEKLGELYIINCPQLTCLFTYVIAQRMTELKILHIRNCSKLKHIVVDDDKTKKNEDQFLLAMFSNLKSIIISECYSLQDILATPVNECFEKLEEVYILFCPQLTCLFTYVIAQRMTELKKLLIDDCSKLKHIVVYDDKTKKNEDQFTNGHSIRSKIFQKLQQVNIIGCGELKHVFSASVTGGLPQLKELHIRNCDMLEQIIEEVLPPPAHHEETNEIVNNSSDIFTAPVKGCFEKLEKIYIEDCPQLTYLFTYAQGMRELKILEELSIAKCHGLKHIVISERVKGNKKENMVEDEHEFESDLSMFSNLKRMVIRYCVSLQDIFAPPVNYECFEKLEELGIEDCPQLTNLFTYVIAQDMRELKILRISYCSKLKHIVVDDDKAKKSEDQFTKGHSMQSIIFQNLQEVRIFRCGELKHVFSTSITGGLTQLKILKIINCNMLEQIIEEVLPPPHSKETNEIVNNSSATGLEDTKISLSDFESLMYELENLDEVCTSNNSTELPSSQINEKLDKKFTEKDYGSNEVTSATSINSEVDGKSNSETYAQELVDAKSTTGSHLPDQQNQLGQTQSTIKMSQESDPTPKNTSPLQMNRDDPSTSQIKPCSSQVNDNNQSMLDSRVEMVGQHNKVETKTLVSEIQEFQKIDRNSEMASDLQAMEQNFPIISSPKVTQRTDEIEANNIGKTMTSDKLAIPTSVLENIEEIGRERSRGGPATEEATIKTLPIGGDNISLVSGVTIHNSSGANILPHDSQVVKQDNAMNKDKTEIASYKNIKIQEGVNLLDKTEEMGIVSNNNVVITPAFADTRTRLEKYKHFVDLNDSQISLLVEAIEAYPHLWNACEKFTDRFRAFMLKTLAEMLLFLRSESVGSVNSEREKEFLKLCDVAVQLGFEKSWVDEMRQPVVGRDPKLEHAKAQMGELLKRHDNLIEELDSIKAPIDELVKRHNHLTQELHNMKKQLRTLNDYLDVPTKCFDFL
ncbi:hypothetical protein V8G54_035496 [Vigna mungo]|uniref:NB-ARC domain-containing protein n=1 Tax=Vigna mungo TaxID=3915 RepID=A0AAQ3REM3_VIGMU